MVKRVFRVLRDEILVVLAPLRLGYKGSCLRIVKYSQPENQSDQQWEEQTAVRDVRPEQNPPTAEKGRASIFPSFLRGGS